MSAFQEQPRINRYLAVCGLGSRRSVEDLVRAGRVSVNGVVVERLDLRIGPDDRVSVDGKVIRPVSEHRYVALNKPVGFEVSHKPRGGRPSVFSLLPAELSHLRYAGRLDADSRGLLLLSNDGSFVQAITHPSHNLRKTYLVRLSGEVDRPRVVESFTKGIRSGGELLRAHSARFREDGTLQMVLGEGRNRQIRRMAQALGLFVEDLFRTAVGNYDLEEHPLKSGAFATIEPGQVVPGQS